MRVQETVEKQELKSGVRKRQRIDEQSALIYLLIDGSGEQVFLSSAACRRCRTCTREQQS